MVTIPNWLEYPVHTQILERRRSCSFYLQYISNQRNEIIIVMSIIFTLLHLLSRGWKIIMIVNDRLSKLRKFIIFVTAATQNLHCTLNSFHSLRNIHFFQVNNKNTSKKVWNMFKVNNKITRTTSMTSFWCFYC